MARGEQVRQWCGRAAKRGRDWWARNVAAQGEAIGGTEMVIVHHYPELVRLAYLVLPPTAERHNRLLTAHAVVQDALPRRLRDGVPLDGEAVRARVVHRALRRTGTVRPPRVLPQVWGLRFFTPAADAAEIEAVVGALRPPARAAYALAVLADLPDAAVLRTLDVAGVADPEAALAEARGAPRHAVPQGTGDTGALDPSAVRIRPSDLLRRRQRRRAAVAVACAAAVAVTAVTLGADSGPSGRSTAERPVAQAGSIDIPAPAAVPADAWATTTRLDFAAWSTRGNRAADTDLTRRAAAAWSGHTPDVRATSGTRTRPGPPATPPQLLYAGDLAGTSVVLLADTTRLARYTEHPDGTRALDIAAADDSDARSASAVVLTRGPDGTRMLLAPWVTDARVRDLRKPGDAPEPLRRGPDGVVGPVALGGTAGCASVPVLELRSDRAADRNPYLLADLGDLSAAHLTYMPPPEYPHTGRPSEAAGPRALEHWARGACLLADLRGRGLRLVNNWEFAHHPLPDAPGEATWSCVRGFDRTGGGQVTVAFTPPGADAPGTRVVAAVPDSPLCSRSGNDVVAATWWQSPIGTRYFVASGSRDVTRVTASGAVAGTTDTRQLVLPVAPETPNGPAPTVTAETRQGTTVTAPPK